MPDRPITAGERLTDVGSFSQRGGDGPNLWRTLGFRRTDWGPGHSTVEWDATPEYGFVTPNGHVIQGGLVTAILDSAMGGSCWTVLNRDEVFLTADLRVEFFRPTRPGPLQARGRSCAAVSGWCSAPRSSSTAKARRWRPAGAPRSSCRPRPEAGRQ